MLIGLNVGQQFTIVLVSGIKVELDDYMHTYNDTVMLVEQIFATLLLSYFVNTSQMKVHHD